MDNFQPMASQVILVKLSHNKMGGKELWVGAGRGGRETEGVGDYSHRRMKLSRSKFEEVQNKIECNLHSTALEVTLVVNTLILIGIYCSLRLR